MTGKNIIYANIAVLLFSLAAVLGHTLQTSSEIIVWGRTTFSVIVLIFFINKKNIFSALKSSKKSTTVLLLSGLLLCAHWYYFFAAVTTGSVSIALITFACFPLFIIIYNFIFFSDRRSLTDLLTSFFILIGIIIMVPKKLSLELTPWLFGFISSFTFAGLTILNKKLVKTFTPITISFIQNLVCSITLTFGFISLHELSVLNNQQWFLLAICGILCTAVAHTLLVKSMLALSEIEAAFIVNLEPVYGIILAVLFINEKIIPENIAGGSLVVLSVVIGLYMKSRKNNTTFGSAS